MRHLPCLGTATGPVCGMHSWFSNLLRKGLGMGEGKGRAGEREILLQRKAATIRFVSFTLAQSLRSVAKDFYLVQMLLACLCNKVAAKKCDLTKQCTMWWL